MYAEVKAFVDHFNWQFMQMQSDIYAEKCVLMESWNIGWWSGKKWKPGFTPDT